MENDAAPALHQLAEDYWEGVLRRNATLATFYADYRYNDRLPAIGPAGRAEEESRSMSQVMRSSTSNWASCSCSSRASTVRRSA